MRLHEACIAMKKYQNTEKDSDINLLFAMKSFWRQFQYFTHHHIKIKPLLFSHKCVEVL